MALGTGAMLASAAWAQTPAADPLLTPIAEESAARWLTAIEPVRVHGQTYLVGFGGLSVILIRTSAGLILIDGAVPQAVTTVEANIRKLGFSIRDVKYILTSEAHYDHVGGVAALARDSGATVIAGKANLRAMATGKPNQADPQLTWLPLFPGIAKLRGISDGQQIRLGDTVVTAIATPGHTAGSTSWTWKSCEGRACLNIVSAASISAVAPKEYRFSAPEHRALVKTFRGSFARFRTLKCDILLNSHPDQFGGDAKQRALLTSPQPNPFIDPGACAAYAKKGEEMLDTRLASEAATPR
jgi:metallo-beta-lactamase class B